jgi:hypothetical protein
MSDKRTLYDVKAALADKYERLAKQTTSTPKRQACLVRVKRYRRQAMQLAHARK